jgi:starch-binding outer membrane protein, SusD/RagB family
MKKIFILLLLSTGFSISSCNDFLETSSPSEFTQDVVFNSVTYAEYALNGCYARLTQGNMYGARLSLNYSTNSDIEFVGADNNSYNQTGNRGQSNYFSNAGESQMNWNELYTMVERANLVIKGINDSPILKGENQKEKNLMLGFLGEALTLRAIAYLDLVRHWGDVPFKLEPTKNDLSNVYLGPTDRDVIYEQLIKDLQEAEGYLPWMGGGTGYSNAERITKGFAKGLMARIALMRGGYSIRNKPGFPTERGSDWRTYYEIANQQCKEIMAQNVHQLTPSFQENFKKMNRLEINVDYKENLFEVGFGLSRSGEMGYSIGVRFYTNAKYGYGNNANVVQTSAYYLYMFDQGDLRRDATIAYYKYGDASGKTQEIFAANPMDYNFQKWDQRYMGDKWLSQNKSANGKIGYGINWVMMRYSDVLLMFAETENALRGPNADAKAALAQVRRRAFPSNLHAEKVDNYVGVLSDETSFFSAIVKERALEFGGEGIRKYDLIRWNLLSAKIQEQRDAITKMLRREAPYNNLPSYLYLKYDANNEVIDKAEVDFYSERDTTGTHAKYVKVQWLSGLTEANKTSYIQRVNLFSSGLDNVIPNRHLYPISSTAISESRGLLSNAYNY